MIECFIVRIPLQKHFHNYNTSQKNRLKHKHLINFNVTYFIVSQFLHAQHNRSDQYQSLVKHINVELVALFQQMKFYLPLYHTYSKIIHTDIEC